MRCPSSKIVIWERPSPLGGLLLNMSASRNLWKAIVCFLNRVQLSACYKVVLSVQVTPTDRQQCGGLLLSLMRVKTCIVYSRTIDQYLHSEQICTQLFFISRHRITIFPTKNPAASVENVKSHPQFTKVDILSQKELSTGKASRENGSVAAIERCARTIQMCTDAKVCLGKNLYV